MIQLHRRLLGSSVFVGALAVTAAACAGGDALEPHDEPAAGEAAGILGDGGDGTAEVAAVSAALPRWGFAALGSRVGASGIVNAQNEGAVELYLGGDTRTFGDNDYWYALRYAPATGTFDQVYVSDQLPERIRRIALARGPTRTDIVVALFDGTVRRYHQATKRLMATRRDPCFHRGGLLGFTTADLDGNGTDETISSCADRTVFASGADYGSWRVTGAGSSPLPADIAVGQMDGDPALEIATTGGAVIDSATRSIQWRAEGELGRQVLAADIDADGRDELIVAENTDAVRAFDVELQLQKWEIPIFDVGSARVADIDQDGAQEILVGDGQWGGVHAFDPVTLAEEWAVESPDAGVSQIAVVDVDGDGDLELVWGAGGGSTGPDHLRVTEWQTGAVRWQSIHLDGPFVGPEVGDLDGDGVEEMVVVSSDSEDGQESGRIVVIDGQTLTTRAISQSVAGGNSATGVQDVAVRDLDGDGRPEILVATDRGYDGVIEAYRFSAANAFTLLWTSQIAAEVSALRSIEVADIDGDGEAEVLGGTDGDFSGDGGAFVRVYDAATGAEEDPLALEGTFSLAMDLVVGDTDDDGDVEVAAVELGGAVHVFDGATRAPEATIQAEGTALTAAVTAEGLVLLVGDSNGRLSVRRFDGTEYAEVGGADLGGAPLDGLTVLRDGRLMVGAEGVLRGYEAPLGAEIFSSRLHGWRMGHRAARLRGSPLVFSAGEYGVHGFRVP